MHTAEITSHLTLGDSEVEGNKKHVAAVWDLLFSIYSDPSIGNTIVEHFIVSSAVRADGHHSSVLTNPGTIRKICQFLLFY